jgi:hypothetical protein
MGGIVITHTHTAKNACGYDVMYIHVPPYELSVPDVRMWQLLSARCGVYYVGPAWRGSV